MYLEIMTGFFLGTSDQLEMILIPKPLADAGGFMILMLRKLKNKLPKRMLTKFPLQRSSISR